MTDDNVMICEYSLKIDVRYLVVVETLVAELFFFLSLRISHILSYVSESLKVATTKRNAI